ncbi:cell division protein SepF [Candidatus Pacearchaeota archaeon]|nr:cell division protein SepF [Candidatus Pacearchaeota archaeon]
MVLKKLKEMFTGVSTEADYVEIDLGQEARKSKVLVRPFILRQFDDINEILNTLREGYTIAVIDIRPLKTKDVIELKRAISKVKKTAEALEGSIAGFGENIIIVTPSFAEIHKAVPKPVAKGIELFDEGKFE